MSIVWEDAPGRVVPGGGAGKARGSHAAIVVLAVLFCVVVAAFAVAILWPGAGRAPVAPQPAADVSATPLPEGGAGPVSPTAPRLAQVERPLADGSERFVVAPKSPRPAVPAVDDGPVAALPGAAAEPVPVAETEADVVAIEAELAAAGADTFALPEAPAETAAADPAEPAMVTARAREWVNLRAGPDNGAEVLAVVPGGDDLRVEPDCSGWCAVAWDGRRGYIYESFIAFDR
ncbi:SH3 domain-containing protein [Oricola thermophila]|uniref:SH3 domain-containing protein n=1 Tax=Oricola thermophila TaxID=2742145 RepID=A0A6N1VFZ6_9HYPH|nr:SH3 domain-containing protein [Oricola thermophila]QKV19473.1 SH3 domain-containing protein [Oricola thermophila]